MILLVGLYYLFELLRMVNILCVIEGMIVLGGRIEYQ